MTNSDYFDDDEKMVEQMNDEILQQEASMAILKQMDGVVSWEIEGLYVNNDPSRTESKSVLNETPPILKISNSEGESVSFDVTPEFAKTLGKAMEDAHRAHYGAQPKTTYDSLKDWVKDNRFKLSALALSIVIIVVLGYIL